MELIRCLAPLLTIVVHANAVEEIRVSYGQLSVAGYKHCKITHNTETLNYEGPQKKTIPGLRYGLISYRCDNIAGHLISRFECKNCGFYCSYNEHIEGCQQREVQFWVAAVLGVLTNIIIGGLVFTCLYKTLTSHMKRRFDKIHRSVTVNPETKVIHDICFLNTKKNNEPYPKPKVEEPTVELKKSWAHHEASSKGLATIFATLFLSKSAGACDVTLLMSSNYLMLMCHAGRCQDTPVHSFPVNLGQTVCVQDYFGGNVSLTVSEITYRSRYELMYYTSDYNVNLTTLEPGAGLAGACLTDNKECLYSSSFCVSDYNNEKGDGETKSPHGRHCQGVEVKGFKDHRIYACCHSYWNVERTGKLYPIYKKTTQNYWIVKLDIQSQIFEAERLHVNKYQQQISLDTYDPTYDLTGYGFSTVEKIPLTILNAKTEGFPSDGQTSSLILDDKPYYVIAAEAHKPETGLFGDFQVSLQKTKEMYDPPVWGTHVACKAEYSTDFSQIDSETAIDDNGQITDMTCPCSCKFPGSTTKRFITYSASYNSPDDFLMRGKSDVIDIFETVSRGTLDVKIGDWTLADLKKRRAKCDIEYSMTYGCVSCKESSYVVLETQHIEEEGIVPFYSNCSFDKRYIKCDVEPTKLVPKEHYQKCLIIIPMLNKTMLIDLEYIYLGGEFRPEETSFEAFNHLLANSYFHVIFINTSFFCFFLGFVITLCFVILNLSKHMTRTHKEITLNTF